jgi:hypothetical protein
LGRGSRRLQVTRRQIGHWPTSPHPTRTRTSTNSFQISVILCGQLCRTSIPYVHHSRLTFVQYVGSPAPQQSSESEVPEPSSFWLKSSVFRIARLSRELVPFDGIVPPRYAGLWSRQSEKSAILRSVASRVRAPRTHCRGTRREGQEGEDRMIIQVDEDNATEKDLAPRVSLRLCTVSAFVSI